ncbi:MAG: hypothetical protein ABIG71_02610 [Candidatus Uhrbacteria bacterium]
MDKNLKTKLLQLQEGERVRINGKAFVIQERSFHPADLNDEFGQDTTRYELGDNYILEFVGDSPAFFQIIKKEYLFGFTGTNSRVEKIETIEIL